jgi:hypothetical protein
MPGIEPVGRGTLADRLMGSPLLYERIINRNPQKSTQYSRSLANEGGPQVRGMGDERGQDWSPYGIRETHPFRLGMPRSLMSVEQATGFYQSAVGLWPANGQGDVPNYNISVVNQLHLEPTTSAHAGYTNPTGPNPNMVFIAPPIFGFQTKPIMATGW